MTSKVPAAADGPWRAEEMFGSFNNPPHSLGWVVVRGKPGDTDYAFTMTPGGETEAHAIRDALNWVASLHVKAS